MIKYLVLILAMVLPTACSTVSNPDLTEQINEPKQEIDTVAYCEDEAAILLLKRWEGFAPVAKWDVTAYRNGWGTKSRSGEKITLATAETRLLAKFYKVRNKIAEDYPNLDRWETNIMAVMAFNVGSFGTRLDRALRTGDIDTAGRVMQLYVNSNGEKLQGLVNRRKDEYRLLTAAPENRSNLIQELSEIVNKHIQKAKYG